jgi:hypothetical protein
MVALTHLSDQNRMVVALLIASIVCVVSRHAALLAELEIAATPSSIGFIDQMSLKT